MKMSEWKGQEVHCCPGIPDDDAKRQLSVAQGHLSYAAHLVGLLHDGKAHEGAVAEAEYDALHGLQHLRKALAGKARGKQERGA